MSSTRTQITAMRQRPHLVKLSLLASAVLAASGVAHAQLEEVIVTAQGREQSLQDVPVAVSVVSGNQLEEQGIFTLDDVSTRLGNVKISSGNRTNSLNVRGVGSGDNPGFEQAVATFADGVYRSRSRATSVALFDVDRVEVLKGPQTTFFGANAIAGALNITTRKPGREFEANVMGMYGEDNEYNLEGGVTLPLTETLSARFAGRANGSDGYVDLDNGGEGPAHDSFQGRAAFNWLATDSWTVDLRVDYAEANSTEWVPFQMLHCPAPAGFPVSAVCGQILAANPGFSDKLDDRSSATGSWQDFDFFETVLTNAIDVGEGTVRAITAYNDMNIAGYLNMVPGSFPGTVGGDLAFPAETREEYTFFSQEVRYESATGGSFEYMFGAYFSTADLNYSNLVAFNFMPFGGIVENALGVDYDNFGPETSIGGWPWMKQTEYMRSVFASGTFYPTDDLRINLGARWTEVEKSAHRGQRMGTSDNARMSTFVPFSDETQLVTLPGTTIQVPWTREQAAAAIVGSDLTDFDKTRRVDRKFMPSIGFQYDLNDNTMLYAKYNKGFKAGGFSGSSAGSTFGPEFVDAYEAGMKSELFDRSLALNLALFYMEYEGLQETTYDANLASTIANVGESVSQGVELSSTWTVTPNLIVNADIAWLDAEYRDFPAAECTKAQLINNKGCVQDLSGKDRANAPEWSGSLSAEWTVPMGANELRITPVVTFSSAYYLTATADPLFRQDAYEKYDLRIGYGPADREWEIALLGKNLTDEVTSGFMLGVPGGDGSVTAQADRGRWFGVQFMRNFW